MYYGQYVTVQIHVVAISNPEEDVFASLNNWVETYFQ